MKRYYVEFDGIYLVAALLILIIIIIVSITYGYVKGIRTAERKFCDDYLIDALT